MTQPSLGPFLRWAGSKRQVLPTLSKYWSDDFTRYVEPFAGSASLFFHLRPGRAQISDANRDLMEAYRQIKHNPEEVASLLHTLPLGKASYYRIREIDPRSLDDRERAARFIYLNRFCFNGLYRTNKSGGFNVPYGGDKAGSLPSLKALKECSQALGNATLISCDFRIALNRVEKGDFVFLDPPYTTAQKRTFTEYGPQSFSEDDFRDLVDWLSRMSTMGIRFVMTYEDSREARTVVSDYHAETISVRRNIAGFASNRRTASEWLITNINLPA